MLTDPPFMPQKDQPAFHLRPWTPDELAQCRRLIDAAERAKRENCQLPKETSNENSA
jgi:hypothetical protein